MIASIGQRTAGAVIVAAAWMFAACSAGQTSQPTPAPQRRNAREGGCTLADFKTDGSIGARFNAATRTLAYGRPAAEGHYRAYLSDADGSHERRLTNPAWAENRHQFVVEWHPSGKYLYVEVEKANHPRSSNDAIPGYGAYTDLWVVSRDGSRAWKLVDLPNDYDHALTHAAASPDGAVLAWTERVKAPNLFHAALWAGSYVFHLADFVGGETDGGGAVGAAPHLENIRSFVPGGKEQGGEVDGVAADNRTIAFYSTFRSGNLFASRIYTWDTRQDAIQELSSDSFSQAPRFAPGGKSLVYMSGSGADIFFGDVQGADWWVVQTDGTGRRRLTSMNKRGSLSPSGTTASRESSPSTPIAPSMAT